MLEGLRFVTWAAWLQSLVLSSYGRWIETKQIIHFEQKYTLIFFWVRMLRQYKSEAVKIKCVAQEDKYIHLYWMVISVSVDLETMNLFKWNNMNYLQNTLTWLCHYFSRSIQEIKIIYVNANTTEYIFSLDFRLYLLMFPEKITKFKQMLKHFT
jgi:hypothetical protein